MYTKVYIVIKQLLNCLLKVFEVIEVRCKFVGVQNIIHYWAVFRQLLFSFRGGGIYIYEI